MADFLDKLWDLEPTIAVEVARSRLTASFPQKSLLGLFLGLGLLFFVAYYLGEAATALRTFRHENNYFSFDFAWSIGVSLLFVWIIWNCIQIIGGYHQVLIANPTELELQTIVFGRIWSRVKMNTTDVSNLRFAQVALGRYGPVFGMRCESAGRKYKFFRGMNQADANILLPKLQMIGIRCENQTASW